MSEATIFKPLIHHTLDGFTSGILDDAIGLSWRNSTIDHLINTAAMWELKGYLGLRDLVLRAAVLKEDAIKHGINLEDKL